MKKVSKTINFSIFILFLSYLITYAKPAPWYKWQSKLTGRVVCLQSSPGEGWEKFNGPYKDPRCKVPGVP
jgi:hypothetical protein